jgi:hypothetical protein
MPDFVPDSDVHRACGNIVIAMVHVCMDTYEGLEPSALPIVYANVSLWGLQTVLQFFSLIHVPNEVSYLHVLEILEWHGGSDMVRNNASGRAHPIMSTMPPDVGSLIASDDTFAGYVLWLKESIYRVFFYVEVGDHIDDEDLNALLELLQPEYCLRVTDPIQFFHEFLMEKVVQPKWNHWLDFLEKVTEPPRKLELWTTFAHMNSPQSACTLSVGCGG